MFKFSLILTFPQERGNIGFCSIDLIGNHCFQTVQWEGLNQMLHWSDLKWSSLNPWSEGRKEYETNNIATLLEKKILAGNVIFALIILCHTQTELLFSSIT
ncbi:hypothetical protein ILYODFUR_019272 [Ilyodon furcidens]|uniref:Uncharacterized protein n=1 Tax=Ilyodon furcidens TaxID=33524 RepID=A0ABV0V4B9_9TELE